MLKFHEFLGGQEGDRVDAIPCIQITEEGRRVMVVATDASIMIFGQEVPKGERYEVPEQHLPAAVFVKKRGLDCQIFLMERTDE